MKHLVLRGDGNETVGLGHLYRLAALGDIYLRHHRVILVTSANSVTSMFNDKIEIVEIPDFKSMLEEPMWFNQNFDSSVSSIILDGYNFGTEYQLKLRFHRFNTIIVDDLEKGEYHSDIIINHSLGAAKHKYVCSENTKLALGPGYSMLRKPFLKAASITREILNINIGFVCFGGADRQNLSLKAVEALLAQSGIKHVHLVLGAANLNAQNFSSYGSDKVTVHINLSAAELVKVMSGCQIGIVPCSTILYELCAVKMLVVAGWSEDNQMGIYNGAKQSGLIKAAGNLSALSKIDLVKLTKELIDDENFDRYLLAQSQLFDNLIEQRFLDLIPAFNVREANKHDMFFAFEVNSDPETRNNSYNRNRIDIGSHELWFLEKLHDLDYYIYILEVNGLSAGIVRFQRLQNEVVIGLALHKNFRYKGYAKSLLHEATTYFKNIINLPILAYIKKHNIASLKAFAGVGYKLLREEIISGTESLVYIYENNE